MFTLERWEEIFETISKNKLRTFLTGVSVASGIFILVILLGVSTGMQNGVQQQFQRDAANRISVWTGVTSVEYKGLNPGRRIQLKNRDYALADRKYKDQLEYKSALYRIWGGLVNYKNESGSYRVEGVLPDYQFLESEDLTEGRYINYSDNDQYRKVAVIGMKVYNDLFKDKKPAVNRQIEIRGVLFKVVGVYSDPGGEREEARVFVPLKTAQKVFGAGDNLDQLAFTLPQEDNFEKAVKNSQAFTEKLSRQLKEFHTVAPEDVSAIRINNSLENMKNVYATIYIVRLFFWFVGVATIFAGVVGVSNIMLIIVKERTKEIGIRKALGAQPLSVIGMVLHESIFITIISGFTGLLIGMFFLQFISPYIPFFQSDFIYNPTVNFQVAVTTVLILIIAGAFAGFFPAWRAARIKPIVALRDE